MSECQDMLQAVDKAARKIGDECGSTEVALIAGSGLGGFAGRLSDRTVMPYKDIPGFPLSTVPGHAGEWITGTIAGKRISLMSGRVHCYEGHDACSLAFPARVMARLGVQILIVTNAAGGVNKSYQPGDFMLISDFINLSGIHPLCGPNIDELGPRFPDMSNALDGGLRNLARSAARDEGFDVREGVYAMMSGPAFETPAEIRMLRILGADAVGMSTVPEIITARHAGIKTLGISCITNMAAGILDQPLSHKEVLETGELVKERFALWMARIIENI
ncbi:MAG: purine-nucleoside phosphorylase [Oscillospiraceae bacterium]|nr:purine-nucleoside phosphorylase [Oscillospiraceae bacterium]